jgi:putative oxidoreductase
MPWIFSRNSKSTEIVITLIRITIGVFLVYHGMEVFDKVKMNEYAGWMPKFMKFSPSFIAYTGKTAELVAGVLMILGMFTRFAALIVIATFAFITFKLGDGRILMEEQHPFNFLLFGLFFLFFGAGRWGLDKYIFKKKYS